MKPVKIWTFWRVFPRVGIISSLEWHFLIWTGRHFPVSDHAEVFYPSAPLLRSKGYMGLTWTGD